MPFQTEQQTGAGPKERARRVVLGYLCPMILHDTNNVLTVLAGLRQLLNAGQTMPERVGPMIDGQLGKMEGLLNSIRWIGADDSEGEAELRNTNDLATNLEALLQLAGKGRTINVSHDFASASISASTLETLALSCLCTTFAALPPKGESGSLTVDWSIETSGDSLSLHAKTSPVRTDLRAHPDVILAFDLMSATNGSMTLSQQDSELVAHYRCRLNS